MRIASKRFAHRDHGQSLLEYGLILAVLLLALGTGWAAVSRAENQYFGFLGPNLAPTPPTFDSFPFPTATPTPSTGATSTPIPLPSPTPTSTPNPALNQTTTTLDCGPASVIMPASGTYATTCTVTVTNNSTQGGHPTGTVTWSQYPTTTGSFLSVPGGSPTNSCTLNNLGPQTATCQVTYSTSAAGSRTLSAFYAGTTGNNGFASSGASAMLTVLRESSNVVTCTYPAQPNPQVVGAETVCEVTITDTSGGTKVVPTGSVSWAATPSSPGGTGTFSPTTCSLSPASSSSASCQVMFVPTSITSASGFSFSVAASFPGDATHATSNGLTRLNVGPASTSIQTFDVIARAGQTSVTLTANISVDVPSTLPSSSINQGTVTFTVSGNATTYCTSQAMPVAAGAASAVGGATGACTLPANVAPGSYTITARYSGTANFLPSTGIAFLSIGLIDTTATVADASVPYGVSSATLNATLVVDYPAVGQVNQGTVSFIVTSGSTTLCSTSPATVNPNAGGTTASASATCAIPSGTMPGSYTINATYSGGSNFNPSTSPGSTVVPGTLTIAKRSTTTTVICAPSTLNAGDTTTCTARILDSDIGTASTPSGAVSWMTSGGGSFASTSCTLNASGTCQVNYTPVDGGTQTLTAIYGEDQFHLTSSGTASLIVHRTTATQASCQANPTDLGVATTCTATVTDTSPVGTRAVPGGTIAWSVSPAGSGAFSPSTTCTLDASGVCSATFTPGLIGSLTITSTYSGTSVYLTGNGPTTLTVNKRTTSTSLSCAPNPDGVGTATTCTATVTDSDGGVGTNPTGGVSWSSDKIGTFAAASGSAFTPPATCTLAASTGNGTAICQVLFTPGIEGTHTLTAAYGGDATTHASSSGTNTLAAVLSTTTTITCTPSPDAIDAPTTCRAAVTSGGVTTPAGTVSWTTNTGPNSQFSTLGCTLDGTGACSVTYTPLSYGTGNSNTLTASYSGDGAHLASTGNRALSVIKRTSGAGVSCSPNPVGEGASTVCTATVIDTDRGTPSTPTGSVSWSVSPSGSGNFSPITCTLNASGACSVTYSAPSIGGSYTLAAAYSGDTLFVASTSPSYSVSVLRTTSTTPTCSSSTDTAGTPVTCTVTVTDTGSSHTSPTGTVRWTVSPSGSGAFSPQATCTLSGGNGNGASSTCSITYTPSAVGSQTITATYGGDVAHVGSSGSAGIAVSAGPASRLSVVPSAASTTAGTPINLTVTALDALGNLATGYRGTVHFTSSDGQAILPANYTFAASDNGTHVFTSGVTLRTAGNQTVTAADTVTSAVTATSDPISVSAATASKLAFSQEPGNTVAATAISPAVTAQVQDAFGNPISNSAAAISMSIGTNPSGGTLSGTTTVSAANGLATFGTLSINHAGTGYTLTASSTGLTPATSSPFNITPGPPVTLAFTTQPANTLATASINPSVQVAIQDANGNTVTTSIATITITIGSNPGGGTLSGTTTVSAVNGVATFSNLSIDKAGTGYTLNAASSGLTTATSTSFNISVGPASRLAFTTQPSNTVAGASVSPAVQVTVQDAGGNTVGGSTASITVGIGTNPASGTLSGTATVSAVNGVATFSNLSINKTGSGYTLTASTTGLTAAASAAFNVTPGVASKLAFAAQPSTTAAGQSINPAVQVAVQDALGNTVTSSTASVTIAIGTNPGGGALGGIVTTPAVSGVATFSSLSINRVGTGYTLTASSTGLTSATSASFNITPGAATSLAFTTQPSNTVAGASISPAVQVTVQDAFGDTITSSSAVITMGIGTNPGGGTLSGTTSVSAVSGVATFSGLSINRAGAGYTLTASSSGLTAETSNSFSIAPGTPSKLAFASQPGTTAAGQSINPAVQVAVQDALGNTVTSSTASVTIAIGTNPGGGALGGIVTTPAVSGVATFSSLSITRVGTGYTLTASSTGLTSATSTGFNVTPGAVSKLVVSAPSSTTAGLAQSVTVTAVDVFGNTVTGYTGAIHFTSSDSQAAVPADYTFVTGDSGTHTFTNGVTLKTAGSQTVTATDAATGSITGTSNPVTVTAAAASVLGFNQQPGNTLSATSIAPALTVQVLDSFGNPLTTGSAAITIAIGANPGSGTLSGTTSVSAINGVATFSNLSIDRAANGYTLTASSSGLASATSTSFNVSVGPASRLAFTTQPTNTVAGVSISPAVQVTVQDAGGNPITTSTAAVTIAIGTNPGGGTLGGTATVSAVNGVASFNNLSVNKTGTGYTLVASAASLAAATSSGFNITPGSATKVAFTTQPGTTAAGASISPAVQVAVQDPLGNTVTSSTAAITIAIGANPGVGTLSGTTTVSAVNGVAGFTNLAINKVGTGYTLSASSTGLGNTASNGFNITPGTVSGTASRVVGNPTSVLSNGTSTSTITVTLVDGFGNPVSGKTVTLSQGKGHSTITAVASTTNSSGQATFTVTDTRSEAVTYTATDATDVITVQQTASVTFV